MGRALKTKILLNFDAAAEAAAALAGMLENWWESPDPSIAQIGRNIQAAIDNPKSPQRLLEEMRAICEMWSNNKESNPIADVLNTDEPLIACLTEPRLSELVAYLRTTMCPTQLSNAAPESVPVVVATKVVPQNLAGVLARLDRSGSLTALDI